MPLVLPGCGLFELEEKRSRFIGYCMPISSETDARQVIAQVAAEHPKANHNVYAYSISSSGIVRASDNGEPSGTAGVPVLNVFQKTGVIDFVCVVTRYFGGVMLGAGGLVRAYSKAAKGALDAAGPQELIIKTRHNITVPYSQLDQLKYKLEKLGADVLHINYTTTCTLVVEVTQAQEKGLAAALETLRFG